MAGNETSLCKYIFEHKNALRLPHLGLVTSISIPSGNEYIEMASLKQLELLATQDSRKKADIYINGTGISIKQSGSSFSYNRLQRSELINLFQKLNLSSPAKRLNKLDHAVDQFHKGQLERRNRPWQDFFSEEDFKTLLEDLMMNSSPNVGTSSHPAEYVMEAPMNNINDSNIQIFSFTEYFNKYKNKFKIAIRRQWIGQSSNSEHNRAVGLAKKEENKKWVYDSISGTPRTGWRNNFPERNRKTVYFLMIEKEN